MTLFTFRNQCTQNSRRFLHRWMDRFASPRAQRMMHTDPTKPTDYSNGFIGPLMGINAAVYFNITR